MLVRMVVKSAREVTQGVNGAAVTSFPAINILSVIYGAVS